MAFLVLISYENHLYEWQELSWVMWFEKFYAWTGMIERKPVTFLSAHYTKIKSTRNLDQDLEPSSSQLPN